MDSVLPIVLHPHQALRKKAEAVLNVDGGVYSLLMSMINTLHGANGVGLAAPQIDRNLRLVVFHDTEGERGSRVCTSAPPLLMVNPTIVAKSDEMIDSEEGCLSIPRMYGTIQRHAWVKVEYVDEHGNPRTVEGEDLLGRCLQHELDHLDGILFIDHLSRLKRDMLMKKYSKTVRPDFLAEPIYPVIGG